VPHYWLGMVLVIIFSVELNWLPAVGAGPGGSGACRAVPGKITHS
jgi:peptide/nickel transport system permease protein